MKKIMTFCIFSLFIVGSTFGQNSLFSGIKVGLNADLQGSLLVQQHNYGYSLLEYKLPKLGYGGGVSAAFLWDDTYGVQIDLLYSSQGAGYYGFLAPDDNRIDKEVTLNYFKVPITYKHYIPLDGYSSTSPIFHITVGAQFAYLLGADVVYQREGAVETLEEAHYLNPLLEDFPGYDDLDELFLKYDYAVVLGFGVEIPLEGDFGLLIEGRANIGVSDVNAREWRFGHHTRSEYNASRNMVGIIRAGLLYNIY